MNNTCPKCHSEIPDPDAKFCPTCGADLQTVREPQVCKKCGASIPDPDVKFCPKCGADLQAETESWVCQKCGTENSPGAAFCASCGISREKQSGLLYSQKFRYGILIALVMLLGGLGSYFYFNGVNEDKYLTYYVSAARDINDIDTVIDSQITAANLKSSKPDDLTAQIKLKKNDLEEQIKTFSQMKPFKNYESQHNDLISLLQKENAFLDQIIQLVSNPLDPNTDSVVKSMQENVTDIGLLSTKIQVPNANFVPGVNLSAIPDRLKTFVTEQKTIYKERTDKLAANKDFFNQMDESINRYAAARTDLGKMLETTRKSNMTWKDYFDMLDRAKSDRTSIRYTVGEIKPAPGTEGLKQEFMSVLDEAIRYCEMMRAAANLGFNNYGFDRFMKEQESKDVDSQVKAKYDAFMQRYESEKSRLTNINNL